MMGDQQPGRLARWGGIVCKVLVGGFLLLDGVMKLFKPPFVVEATTELGFSAAIIVPLGVVLTASSLLYLWPRTAVLGAILLTGYLGGAVATHVLVGHGPFEIGFPVFFGCLVWLGLVLGRPCLWRCLLGRAM